MRPHVVHWLESVLPGGLAAQLAPTWFTCVGVAGIVMLFVMRAVARRHRIDPGIATSVVLWCYVAAVSAGIAVPMAIDAIEQLFTTGRVHLHWAGMTSFWGYLGGAAAIAVVCRSHGIPLARVADLAAAPLGLALVLARLGCFLAGCDYGKVTSVPWAIRFPSGTPAWHDHVAAGLIAPDRAESLPVHPAQLYEAALGVAIAVLALAAARWRPARRRDGHVFLLAAAVYATGRLLIESVRGDAGRGIYLGLSSGQIFSLAVLAAIAAALALRRPRRIVAITASAATALALGVIDAPAAQAQPAGVPIAPPPSAAAGASEPHGGSSVHVGALLGVATPFNRRPEQVATLGGPSLSLGLVMSRFGVWLDLDSLGNRDASHGSVLLSGSMIAPVGDRLQIGGRIGLGATLVNFDDPAFRDVAGTAVRFEMLAEYSLGESWSLWLRPLSFDILTAADLGGPIATWQARVGLGYHFATRRRAPPAAPQGPPSAYPPAPAQTPPSPYPPPPPYTPHAMRAPESRSQ